MPAFSGYDANMCAHKERYKAFLLRLWQVKQNGHEIWRASLEDSHTGERRGFASLEALMEFLRGQTQDMGDEKDDPVNPISEKPDVPS